MKNTNPDLPSLRHLISALKEPKRKDYTFATLFFIVFSFFIFFAIKPSLSTALSLNSKELELKGVDAQYEELIGQIVQIQSALESVRDRLHLVDEALPPQPLVTLLMQDIQQAADRNNVVISKVNINKINLVEPEKNTFRSMAVSMELNSTFDDYISFQKEITEQRRLKYMRTVEIDNDQLGASTSATLRIKTEIEGYYL